MSPISPLVEIFQACPIKRLGQTQNTLEGLRISSGLETPWGPSGGAGGRCQCEGCLRFFTESDATTATPRKWLNEMNLYYYCYS